MFIHGVFSFNALSLDDAIFIVVAEKIGEVFKVDEVI